MFFHFILSCLFVWGCLFQAHQRCSIFLRFWELCQSFQSSSSNSVLLASHASQEQEGLDPLVVSISRPSCPVVFTHLCDRLQSVGAQASVCQKQALQIHQWYIVTLWIREDDSFALYGVQWAKHARPLVDGKLTFSTKPVNDSPCEWLTISLYLYWYFSLW